MYAADMAAPAGGERSFGDSAGVVRRGISRRSLLKRGAMLGLATALAELPSVLDAKGLLDDARAIGPDVVTDTFSGLVAFVVPGSDPYSVAQGASTSEPGGIAAGTVPV